MAPVLPKDRYTTAMDSSKYPLSTDEGSSKPKKSYDCDLVCLYSDDQLKKLLEEAIAYKRPKDREGKSEVFLELLSQAEDDTKRVVSIGLTPRDHPFNRAASVSERGAAGGSLQNIWSTTDTDSHYTGAKRKNRHRQGPDSSVSSRQREGGSLPSNVDRECGDGWLPIQVRDVTRVRPGSDFSIHSAMGLRLPETTTVRLEAVEHSKSNDLADRTARELYPLRRHQSTTEHSDVRAMNDEGRVTKSECVRLTPGQKDEVSSTTGADFTVCDVGSDSEILPGSSTGGGAYRATASFQLGIDPGDRHQFAGESSRLSNGMQSIDLNWEDRSVQCLLGSAAISDRNQMQRRVADSSSLRHTDVSYPKVYGISSAPKAIEKRPEDIGTGVGRVCASSKKNNKRKQNSDKNVAVTRSEDMPGHRSDLAEGDVNVILNFIESDGKPSKGLKKQSPKQKIKDNKKQTKKFKASSLEELSQRNIDDLTESSDEWKPRVEEQRRSWGDKIFSSSEAHYEPLSHHSFIQTEYDEDSSDSEFQMVTKKTRRRRGVEAVAMRVRNRRGIRRSPRRKSTSSVPPSERSADSDLDSVHSLPAVGGRVSDSDCDNSSVPVQSNPTPAPSTAVLPIPQSRVPPQKTLALTTEDFPSLPVKPDPKPEIKLDMTKPKTRSKSVGPNTRPPVILLDERRQQSSAVCEFTFGFEVNQQLLQTSASVGGKPEEVAAPRNEPATKRMGTMLPKPAWKPVEMPPQQRSLDGLRIADTLSFTTPNLTFVPPTSAYALRKPQNSCTVKTYSSAAVKPCLSNPIAWKTPTVAKRNDGSAGNPGETSIAATSAEPSIAMTPKTTHEQILQGSAEACIPISSDIRSQTNNRGLAEKYPTCPNECRHLVVVVMPQTQDSPNEPVRVSETGTMTEELVEPVMQPIETSDRKWDEPGSDVDNLGGEEEHSAESEEEAGLPQISRNHRSLVEFLSRRFQEALADPDTVIYKE